MLIQGKWSNKGSAAHYSATLRLNGDDVIINTENGLSVNERLNNIDISDRLGNIERKLTLSDGSVFSTHNNDAIDTLFKHSKKTNRLIHTLESHMVWVAVALVVTILTTFSFITSGVPWISEQIAHALPHKTNELIASQSLEFLDDFIFEESQLTIERQEKIRAHFWSKLIPLDKQNHAINYKLHFRNWSHKDLQIPNAFALPSGDIILTDKFVELSKEQHEIDAVLLHEIGHVVHRHSLETLIETTLIATVVMMISGDTSTIVDMGIGLGSLLISSQYSRDHETEADTYAFEKMLEAKIDPKHFATMMNRISQYMIDASKQPESTIDKTINGDDSDKQNTTEKTQDEDTQSNVTDYFSSHPNTEKRIQQAQRYSECFNKGLTVCSI